LAISRTAARNGNPKEGPRTFWCTTFPATALEGHPYGVYDMTRNEAWVSVGRDHDTPKFAVASIRQWWKKMGVRSYPGAKELFITADAGGSNGYRSRAWKVELQALANETKLRIRVSHFPPGTSKWNKIEHRLFCHITQNWRGKPLRTWETVVELIGTRAQRPAFASRPNSTSGDIPRARSSATQTCGPSTSASTPFTATGTTSSHRAELDYVIPIGGLSTLARKFGDVS